MILTNLPNASINLVPNSVHTKKDSVITEVNNIYLKNNGEVSRIWGKSGGDLYWDNVVALLHFDGDVLDKSGKTEWVRTSGGYAAGKFSSGVNFTNTPNQRILGTPKEDWVFGSDDFTIEFYILLRAAINDYRGVLTNKDGYDKKHFECIINPNTYQLAAGISIDNDVFAVYPSLTQNVWSHVVIQRKSITKLQAYVNGTMVGETTGLPNKAVDVTSQNKWVIGGSDMYDTNTPNCIIDELRITKGIGRYSGTFTPLAAPFPNY